MNVEFEPSSLQIKVNEVMNVMHAKPHRLCLSLSRQMPAVYVLCVWLFFFPRGYFFILSLISSLEAIARAVDDHGLFTGAFLLMIVIVHKSLLWQEISRVQSWQRTVIFIFLYPLYFVLYFSPSLLWNVWGIIRPREKQGVPATRSSFSSVVSVKEWVSSSISSERISKSEGEWSRLATKIKCQKCLFVFSHPLSAELGFVF